MNLNAIKYEMKRAAAMFGAALMLFQAPLGHMTVYASVPQDVAVTPDTESVSANAAGTVSGNSQTDAELPAETRQPQQGDLAVNYAYVESGTLSATQKQNILVSVGNGTVEWKDAVLTIEHETTGEKKEIAVSDYTEEALLFSFDMKGCATGVYRVAEVGYTYMDGDALKAGRTVFDESEMGKVAFSLGEDSPFAEIGFTEYDENGDLVGIDGADAQGSLSIDVTDLEGEGDLKIPAGEDVPADHRVAGSLVVVLDPGHDATHAGARANGLEEEELTLKVAEYCKEYLEDNYTDVVVYMTRGEACPYPGTSAADCNASRVAAAKKVGADVYVSLHFNATAETSTTASGAMVFYPNSNYDNDAGTKGATLASKVIEQLEELGLKNNGIKIRNSEDKTTYPDGSLADYYGVIRRSKLEGIPAVIVEHAFLNNASDAAFLSDEDNLEKLGVADAIGIAKAYDLSTEEVEYDADDLEVSEIDGFNGTFRIKLSGATPVSRIAKIEFKVYPLEAKDKVYLYTAVLDNEKKGIYSVVGNVGNHGMTEGKYKVIAYAYNAAGKKAQLRSEKFHMKRTEPDAKKISVATKVYSNEKTVLLKLNGNADAKGVFFKVYPKEAGKKKAKKYRAKKLENGQWSAKIKVSDFKRADEYVVQAYSETYFGTKEQAAVGKFKIKGPSAKSVSVTKVNTDKGTFRVVAKGVKAKAGIKKVTVIVKTHTGKKIRKVYTMKEGTSGNYYADVNMKNFKYQYGTYGVYVKVKDGNGITETVKTVKKKIKQPDPSIAVKLKNGQTKMIMTASDLGMPESVKGVKFKVYPASDSSKKKTYDAKRGKDGSYSKTIAVSDLGKSGKYKIDTYVKGADGKYKKTGKTKSVSVADIKGGKVKIKKRTDSTSYLYVSGISYTGKIESVKIKVWPMSNSKAKYTYKTSKRADGSYRASLDSVNHKGIGGTYKYQVIVESKNGIKKVLLQGKTKLAESEQENDELYEISGDSSVTVAQMMAYYKKNAKYPSYYENSDAPTLKKFCEFYYKECEKEGIRAEVAFAQAMKETNFLKFGGDVDISQYNFAGIGATGGGEPGNSFKTVRLGIRAQVQHLKAYANEEELAQTCVDPRFKYVTRGCAPYVEWLSIKENPYGKGWATDPTYGSALRRMITALRNS